MNRAGPAAFHQTSLFSCSYLPFLQESLPLPSPLVLFLTGPLTVLLHVSPPSRAAAPLLWPDFYRPASPCRCQVDSQRILFSGTVWLELVSRLRLFLTVVAPGDKVWSHARFSRWPRGGKEIHSLNCRVSIPLLPREGGHRCLGQNQAWSSGFVEMERPRFRPLGERTGGLLVPRDELLPRSGRQVSVGLETVT